MEKRLVWVVVILIGISVLLSLFADLGYITGNITSLKESPKITIDKPTVYAGDSIVITVDGGYWGVNKKIIIYKGTFYKGFIGVCEKAPCKGKYMINYAVPNDAQKGIYTLKMYAYNSYVDDRLEAKFTVQPAYSFTTPSNKP